MPTDSRETPGLDSLLRHPGLREKINYPRRFRHTITHHRIEGMVERITLKAGRVELTKLLKNAAGEGVEWKRIPMADLERVVVSSLTPKILRLMGTEA